MPKALLPLAVLNANETANQCGIPSRTWVQKLVYLVQDEFDGNRVYNFVPGKYGPVSPELANFIVSGLSNGQIQKQSVRQRGPLNREYEVYCYSLSEKGKQQFHAAMQRPSQLSCPFEYSLPDITAFVKKAVPRNPCRADTMDLLEEAHRRDPDMFIPDTHITAHFYVTEAREKQSRSKSWPAFRL